MPNAFWPYEEVEFRLRDPARGTFTVQTPWVTSEIEVEPGTPNFTALSLYANGDVAAITENNAHLASLSAVLAALQSLPLAYALPRVGLDFGVDVPVAPVADLPVTSPRELAASLGMRENPAFGEEWSWDLEGALALSAVGKAAFDPLSLLSVARRFHYLDCADDKMGDVYRQLSALESSAARDRACAVIVRQNHYVTEKCESSLGPARGIAVSARPLVEEFMAAERGHDRLLASSLRALGTDAQQVRATEAVQALMGLLHACATHHFFAFALALDFFEKPQFRDEDTLGEKLAEAGRADAATGLQAHKNINDQGGHESVSATLLEFMRPIDRNYATLGFRMAELVSAAIARVPYEIEAEMSVIA